MSGTSMDGLDLACCEFVYNTTWSFHLRFSETVPYADPWIKKLTMLPASSSEEISEADFEFGSYLGKLTKTFCLKHNITPDFISSHGHTLFHRPSKGFTRQLGSGAAISAASGYSVVCDFRSLDVALGGQGAPLVPIGDKLLFSEYAFCLNLGGIANMSFDQHGKRIAFDVCGCNLILNRYASHRGLAYDKDGLLSGKGKVNQQLLQQLDQLDYYAKPYPKSLGREDVERDLFPIIDKSGLSAEDVLATFCSHIAGQVTACIRQSGVEGKMLITGGGAFNIFLVENIRKEANCEVVIPEKNIIEFKEAIIFGFLGVLRIRKEINCLKSVTGAQRDNCGGAVYHALKN